MRASGPQDLGKDWDERPPEAAGEVVKVGETRVVVEVGETRTGLCHPGYRPGIQSEPDDIGPSRRPPQVAGHQVCPAWPIWP